MVIIWAPQTHLFLDWIAALFRHVHDVEDGGAQVSHGRDGLHFDCVSFLERMIENTRRVHHLPSQVLVVGVAHVQRLGGERIRLHFHVRLSHLTEWMNRLEQINKCIANTKAKLRLCWGRRTCPRWENRKLTMCVCWGQWMADEPNADESAPSTPSSALDVWQLCTYFFFKCSPI